MNASWKNTLILLLLLLTAGCSSVSMDGKKLLRQQHYEDAILLFSEHLQSNPQDWGIREHLGYAFLKNDDFSQAIREFEIVRESRPKSAVTILYLGIAYLKNNQLEEGIAAWNQFQDMGKPRIEEVIKRMMTLLTLAESKKYAVNAVEQEGKLSTIKFPSNSYAILYHNDLSPEKGLRAVQKSLATMLITDLTNTGQFKIIERLRMDSLLDEINFAQTGAVDMKTAPHAGRLLGAENLVVGTISTLLRDLLINSSIVSSRGSHDIYSFPHIGRLANFFELQKKVVISILEKNSVVLTSEQLEEIESFHTQDFDAFLIFGEGLVAQDQGQWSRSRKLFQRAWERDPKFHLARDAYERSPDGLGISYAQVINMWSDPKINLDVVNKMERLLENIGAGLGLGNASGFGVDGSEGGG